MRLGSAVHTWFIYRRSRCSVRSHAAAQHCSYSPMQGKWAFVHLNECLANLNNQKLLKKLFSSQKKKKKSLQSYPGNPEAPSGIDGLRLADTYILHVCWCWEDGWGRMQIFNVVTELDWMFYGLSLSWQRATACKSNWKEGNEGVGTPLYQGLGCKNRIWHCITQRAEFIWGTEIGTISDEKIQYS